MFRIGVIEFQTLEIQSYLVSEICGINLMVFVNDILSRVLASIVQMTT